MRTLMLTPQPTPPSPLGNAVTLQLTWSLCLSRSGAGGEDPDIGLVVKRTLMLTPQPTPPFPLGNAVTLQLTWEPVSVQEWGWWGGSGHLAGRHAYAHADHAAEEGRRRFAPGVLGQAGCSVLASQIQHPGPQRVITPLPQRCPPVAELSPGMYAPMHSHEYEVPTNDDAAPDMRRTNEQRMTTYVNTNGISS